MLELLLAMVLVCPSCGHERWALKTLSDAGAARIEVQAETTSVAALRRIRSPEVLDSARVGPELRRYVVHALIVGWKLESDRDVHLVIAQPGTPRETMIAEVPDPSCSEVCGRPKLDRALATVRLALAERLGRPPRSQYVRLQHPLDATLEGVGFFDFLHGQEGAAPNGLELHPVLRIAIGD